MGGSVELVSEPDIASFELQFPRIAGHLCPGYSPEYLARLGDAIEKNTHLQVRYGEALSLPRHLIFLQTTFLHA